MSSIKRNLRYQTLYQILNVGLPLITAPFLSRVLGVESLGIMSYTNSVVHYFTIFSMMGLTNYGTRSIAIVKDCHEARSDTFSQIFYLQIITTGIALIAYLTYLLLLCKDNFLIAWIQSIAIIACFFDINWFFFGIEEFKITVIRNLIIRIGSVILMLALVRSSSDLWIYALLLVGSTLVSQIVLWFYVSRYVRITPPDILKIKSHILPNIKLFIPILAMSVYHVMDKTMLGVFSTYAQSGYYYNADKVINIPIGVLTGVGTVMLPRMTVLAGENKKIELDSIFNKSIRIISLVSSALCCGIAAVAKEFTPFFFGAGYDDCVILIIVLAPVLFIKGLSLISRNLYLIPNKMESKLTASVIAGAIVNIVFNFILIPRHGALGAAIATLIAELTSCIWQYAAIIRTVKCVNSVLYSLLYFSIGIVMFFCVRLIADHLLSPLIVKLVVEILVGVFVYCSICIITWIVTKNSSFLRLIKPHKEQRRSIKYY